MVKGVDRNLFYVQDVVRTVEKVSTDDRDRPTEDCVIADATHVKVDKPYAVPKEPVKE